MRTYKPNEIKVQNNFTLIEALVVGAIGVMVISIPLLYFGLGTLGWNAVKNKVDYEDKYFRTIQIADVNQDGNLDEAESEAWRNDVGVVLLPNQKLTDARPAYASLVEYIKQAEQKGVGAYVPLSTDTNDLEHKSDLKSVSPYK